MLILKSRRISKLLYHPRLLKSKSMYPNSWVFYWSKQCKQFDLENCLCNYHIGAPGKSVFCQNRVAWKLIQRIWKVYKKSLHTSNLLKSFEFSLPKNLVAECVVTIRIFYATCFVITSYSLLCETDLSVSFNLMWRQSVVLLEAENSSASQAKNIKLD